MGEFLEHYGGLIVAVIVASVMSTFLVFTRDTCNDILDERVNTSAHFDQEFKDVNGIITETAPQLNILSSIIVEMGEPFDPKEVVITAYNSNSFSINEITGSDAKNITNIKKALVPGKVNVVFPAGFTTASEGKYTLVYYTKNTSSGGLWTRKKCRVAIVKYEKSEGKG